MTGVQVAAGRGARRCCERVVRPLARSPLDPGARPRRQKRTFSAQDGDAYLSGLASPVVGSKLGSRDRWQAENASNLHTSGSGPATKF